MEIRFIFKSSSGKPRVHRKRLPVTIGRSDSEEVRLRIPIDSVSRKHCEFFLDEGGTVCVRDLGSTNGTLLNGEPVEPEAAIVVTPGSSLKVGTVVFRVDFKSSTNDPDGDTVSVSEAQLPAAVDKVATEPLEPTLEPDEDLEMESDGDEKAVPATGDFAFLGAGGAGADEDNAEEDSAESSEPDEPEAPGDENLQDFFKGLK